MWLIAGATLAFCSYCRVVVPRFKPGWERLALVLPIIALNLAVCSLFDFWTNPFIAFGLGFNNVWMGSFKVVGLALDRGPLLLQLQVPQYVAVFCLPILPVHVSGRHAGHMADSLKTESGSSSGLATGFVLKATLAMGLSYVV